MVRHAAIPTHDRYFIQRARSNSVGSLHLDSLLVRCLINPTRPRKVVVSATRAADTPPRQETKEPTRAICRNRSCMQVFEQLATALDAFQRAITEIKLGAFLELVHSCLCFFIFLFCIYLFFVLFWFFIFPCGCCSQVSYHMIVVSSCCCLACDHGVCLSPGEIITTEL